MKKWILVPFCGAFLSSFGGLTQAVDERSNQERLGQKEEKITDLQDAKKPSLDPQKIEISTSQGAAPSLNQVVEDIGNLIKKTPEDRLSASESHFLDLANLSQELAQKMMSLPSTDESQTQADQQIKIFLYLQTALNYLSHINLLKPDVEKLSTQLTEVIDNYKESHSGLLGLTVCNHSDDGYICCASIFLGSMAYVCSKPKINGTPADLITQDCMSNPSHYGLSSGNAKVCGWIGSVARSYAFEDVLARSQENTFQSVFSPAQVALYLKCYQEACSDSNCFNQVNSNLNQCYSNTSFTLNSSSIMYDILPMANFLCSNKYQGSVDFSAGYSKDCYIYQNLPNIMWKV